MYIDAVTCLSLLPKCDSSWSTRPLASPNPAVSSVYIYPSIHPSIHPSIALPVCMYIYIYTYEYYLLQPAPQVRL